MNDELARRHAAAVEETLGGHGGMISLSKTRYREQHPDHVAVFNANVCLEAGKVWWGDLDLTLGEGKVAELATRISETVYVLCEHDGRFEHEDEPLLGQALYSVTPSGHTRFAYDYLQRGRDGTLRRRPLLAEDRRRFFVTFGRPRLLRFWRTDVDRREQRTSDGDVRTTLLYIGERVGVGGESRRSPLLVLGFFRRRGRRFWVGFDVIWYPSPKRHAPRALVDVGAARGRGRTRPYVRFVLHPGLDRLLGGLGREPSGEGRTCDAAA